MWINTPTVCEYVKSKFQIRKAASRPFIAGVMLCLANRDYLNPKNEKQLFTNIGECLSHLGYPEYKPNIRPHMRYGIDRGWRICRKRPKDECCPIRAMELMRRAVEIMDWVKESPKDMSCSDARRILWRDNGTIEPFPPFEWPKSTIPEIMRFIHQSSKDSVPVEDIVNAARRPDDIMADQTHLDLLMLLLRGFITRTDDGSHESYSALWTPEEFQNYIRKNVIRYTRLETREEQIARDALLPQDVFLDDNGVKYLGKLLTLIENI